MPPLPQSLTTRALSGFFWTSLATGTNVLVQLVVLVVLARLLVPADFGLAAAALMVVGLSAIFSTFGIGPAVVQHPDLRETHQRAGFTLSVLLGVLFTALLWPAAPAVAAFFRLPELAPLLRTLSLVFPVQGLSVVAESLLQRELRFRCLALLDVTTAVLGYGAVGVVLAFLGFGAWALAGAHLAQFGLRTLLLLCLRPHPAWPLLERRACADLLYFGGGCTASGMSNYVAGQAENLVIGRWLGAAALGVYGRAYQLMAGPAVLFGNVLDRVLFPALAHLQDQPERLGDAYRRSNALVALVILPISGVLVALAPEVVHVLLGPEWQAVTLPLQILGPGMLFRTGCKVSDSLVRATGAVYRRTWRQAAYAVLVGAGAGVGQFWGVEGVAVAVLATLAVNFFLMAHLALGLCETSWRTFAAAHVPGLLLAALVSAPAVAAAALLRAWDCSPLVVLVLSAAAVLPALLVMCLLPDVFLGADGRWLVRKVRQFFFGAAAKEASCKPDAPAKATPVCPTAGATGQALRLLACSLADSGVRYCRWKSSLDVPRVLAGEGDLDLLVARADAGTFLAVAQRHGFLRVVPCFGPDRAAEWHLYGPDAETGQLLHLHVHFSLLGTDSPLQDSLEEMVLRHSLPDATPGLLEGMPVVQPGAEVIAVVLDAMAANARLGEHRNLAARRDKLQARLRALRAADAADGWRSLLQAWLPSVPPDLFAACLAALEQPTSWLHRFRLTRQLSGLIRGRSTSAFRDFLVRAPAFLRRVCWRLSHGRGTPRQLASGGRVIAIIGPDASGKSTLVAETTGWLGKVFRVKAAHLGKPPATWLTLLPSLAWAVLRRLAPWLRVGRTQAGSEGSGSRRPGLLFSLRAVLLAWDRRRLARRLSRLAARGWLVVCDRYPSPTVGAADSARLDAAAALAGWLARLENRLYRDVPSPDLVVRLSAPVAVAVARNQERRKAGKESDDYILQRHMDFIAPPFAGVQVCELPTSTSRLETVQRLRRWLWDRLAPEGPGTAACAAQAPAPCWSGRIEEEIVEFLQN
jgi:O-antigen/teichoic acid export membrane protein/thymidylate kinase